MSDEDTLPSVATAIGTSPSSFDKLRIDGEELKRRESSPSSCDGEGDRPQGGGGGMRRPPKPARTIARAKTLRRKLSLPEVLLWRELKRAPDGLNFRKQHPAGDFVIDFFCARANLAIEVDGISHDMGGRPVRDEKRDVWLREHRIDTVRIPARAVLKDAGAVAESIVAMVCERLVRFGKTPPSVANATATSPSQDDGED